MESYVIKEMKRDDVLGFNDMSRKKQETNKTLSCVSSQLVLIFTSLSERVINFFIDILSIWVNICPFKRTNPEDYFSGIIKTTNVFHKNHDITIFP